jgi:hypothetical protein
MHTSDCLINRNKAKRKQSLGGVVPSVANGSTPCSLTKRALNTPRALNQGRSTKQTGFALLQPQNAEHNNIANRMQKPEHNNTTNRMQKPAHNNTTNRIPKPAHINTSYNTDSYSPNKCCVVHSIHQFYK